MESRVTPERAVMLPMAVTSPQAERRTHNEEDENDKRI